MRILHTSDWHLNDRLGRVERQPDIAARLEELARCLDEYRVDLLLMAGDLFSQHSRPEELREALGKVSEIFKPFLMRSGTMVALAGNHDGEALFNTLRYALDLAAPLDPHAPPREPRPNGRLYLAAQPTYLLLADTTGQLVQFVLLPYPTPTRYLKDEKARYSSLDEKNQLLHESLLQELSRIRERFVDPRLPSVLAAHIHVRGSQLHNLYRLSEREDVTFDPADIPTQWSYVALGHIHKPQALPGAPHVRYSGSIERFDLGEREEDKSAVLVEIGPQGRVTDPVLLPLNATPIYQVDVLDPEAEIPTLAARYPDADRALVSYRLRYRPGEHNRDECIREIEAVFPRWYHRDVVPEGAEILPGSSGSPGRGRDIPGTVREYICAALAEHADKDDVLALAEEYLANQEVER